MRLKGDYVCGMHDQGGLYVCGMNDSRDTKEEHNPFTHPHKSDALGSECMAGDFRNVDFCCMNMHACLCA